MKINGKLFFAVVAVAILLALLASCEEFEDSPNRLFDEDTPININQREIAELLDSPDPDDTLRIAFIGDLQRQYESTDHLIEMINARPRVDFCLVSGDLSEFGLLQEFEWMVERLNRLEIPYVSVIGNHDVLNNGDRVFERMFGPEQFTFVYDSVKFVAHNTNGRDYGFNGNVPDLSWLASQLIEGEDYKYLIPVAHVPPFNIDFDPKLEAPYRKLLAESPGLPGALYGHQHNGGAGEHYGDGVFYVISFSASQPRYTLLDIYDGELHRKVIEK